MHAKGSAAYGSFTVTKDITKYTKARLFSKVGNHGNRLGYEPNSYGEWQQQPDFAEPPLSVEGAADHWNHREDDDCYTQPGALYRLMSAPQRQVLCENTARAMGDAPAEVKARHAGNCTKADPAYGAGLKRALGI